MSFKLQGLKRPSRTTPASVSRPPSSTIQCPQRPQVPLCSEIQADLTKSIHVPWSGPPVLPTSWIQTEIFKLFKILRSTNLQSSSGFFQVPSSVSSIIKVVSFKIWVADVHTGAANIRVQVHPPRHRLPLIFFTSILPLQDLNFQNESGVEGKGRYIELGPAVYRGMSPCPQYETGGISPPDNKLVSAGGCAKLRSARYLAWPADSSDYDR
ncbi:hypothetical protein DFH07DRAFT_784304 [Mycena maculata]|uniref:Uncharacterized protein n=1 Tax=Mycena maculata TaxID=230809 RepID=A0AAD7HHK8_9AGAR|nr:hypothetical protein DFH07DRAFT_784304 [Mycena maculata]